MTTGGTEAGTAVVTVPQRVPNGSILWWNGPISAKVGAEPEHGSRVRSRRSPLTIVQVGRLIDPEWLVETEIDAVSSERE